jgi:hypothetical protein
MACRDFRGYGRLGFGGHNGGVGWAYRIAYQLTKGPIPKGYDVRHFVCHHPPCCNPKHLILGTRVDNVSDMVAAGRWKNAPVAPPDPNRERWERPPDPEYVCHTCGLIFSRSFGRTQIGKHTYCCREHYFAAKEFRLAERFWEKVDKRGPDECWPWLAALGPNGYGVIGKPGGGGLQAHRVAWELAHGSIPAGLIVRHYVCDNRPCCNVAHMKLGTRRQNSEDMVRKGRQATGDQSPRNLHPESYAVGEAHANSKLVPEQVRAIRQEYARGGISFRSLALRYGVCAGVIDRIVHRETWKHIE